MLIRKGLRGVHIYLHAFIYESSHYVQLFTSNLVWITSSKVHSLIKTIISYDNFFKNILVTLVKYFNRAKADPSLGLIGWSLFNQTGYLAWANNLRLQLQIVRVKIMAVMIMMRNKCVEFVIGVYLDSAS